MYTTIHIFQNSTKIYTTQPQFTKLYQTNTQIIQNANLCTNTKLLQNNIHSYTKCYKTRRNFTKLYKTAQNCTRLKKKTIHNSTNLYAYLQEFTKKTSQTQFLAKLYKTNKTKQRYSSQNLCF